MQVVETSSEGLKREFTITVPAEEIEAKITAKLTDLSTQVQLKGFRPGKVPVSLLRRMYGKSVLGEVLEETVNTSSQQALQDNSLTPAMQPKIEVDTFDEGTELKYTMAVEVIPDFEPMDFSTLELERLTAPVTDEQVSKALERLAAQQTTFEPITRARKSKKDDMVVIDFVGKVDGTEFEGGTATDLQMVLGRDQFIPGFEDQLIGAKAGEDVAVEVTFPDAYGNQELAGKNAEFDVAVKEIREPKAVEIDDEFAKQMGLDDLAALRGAIKGQIEQEMAGMSRMRLKRSLLDALAEQHEFDLPTGMVDMEYAQICRQLRPAEGAAGTSDEPGDEHHQDHGHDHGHDHGYDHGAGQADATAEATEATVDEDLSDEQKDEYRRIAVRRVRLGLLLSEVGRRNNIEVGADEVNRSMMEQARRYPGQENEVMKHYRESPQAMAQLRAPLFEDKVVDFVLEMATVSEREVTPEDLARDPDEAEQAADEGADAATSDAPAKSE